MPTEEQKRKKRRVKLSSAKKRLLISMVVLGIMFAALIGKLSYEVIVNGDSYAKKASMQWQSTTSIKADRGEIQDRDGNVLASSYTTYQVCANLQMITQDDRERVANTLAVLLDLDYDSVLAKLNKTSSAGQLLSQVKIKDQVEAETIQLFSAQQLTNELSYYADVKRTYSSGTLYSQLLGFTNTDGAGQTGLELTYNSYLAGTDGYQVTDTDRDGNTFAGSEEQYVAAIPGADLILTTDTRIENYLENALEEACTVNNAKYAMGLVMNPQTGEILAAAGYPCYDNDEPPRSDATALLELAKLRVATDTYEPGSIFKIITLASALESGAVTTSTHFNCKGSLTVAGDSIHCWKTAGHGNQTLTQAAENSCNCAFMSMALKIGTRAFYNYIYAFGFGDSTASGITGETSGSVTHIKYVREPDLARIGFGQSISCTALQLATAVSAAINGGELLKPYIVSQIVDQDGNILLQNGRTVVRRVISEETSATVRSILTSVVENGSGRNAQVYGYSVGGKTGTSQKYEDDGSVSSTKLIASFVGFAPADDPQYLCIIVVDEPQIPVVYGSTVAAPFVQMVLNSVLGDSGIAPDKNNEAVIVPDTTGLSVTDAAKLLRDSGLTATYMEDEASASVQRQAPAAGTVVVKGSDVILYTAWTTVRAEDETITYTTMPDIIGKTRLNAMDALIKAGLTMEYDRTQSAGVVTFTQYAEGTQLPVGTTVQVGFTYTPTD